MKNKLPLILVLLVIGFSTYSFFYLFEPYEETEDLGWDKKARRNPYLAAEQFLTKAGIPVTSSNNFDKLTKLPERGMVFISNSSETLTRKRVENIIEWMEAGGHLVIAAPVYDDDEKDILLSRFNVENKAIEYDSDADTDTDTETREPPKLSEQLEEINQNIMEGALDKKTEEKSETIPEDEITFLKFANYDTSIEAHFSTDSGLTHPSFYKDEDSKEKMDEPLYWTGSEHGVHFMQFEVGYGLLSIMSDNSIWESDRIQVLDHAYLLWLLSNKNSEVVLLYGANMPSIFHYLWKYGSEMLMTLGLLLMAWLFYRSRRFGSIRQRTDTLHRSMAEHIHASAEYLWRDRNYEQLIEPLRTEIQSRLQRLYPGYNNLNPTEQVQLIHDHSTLPTERITTALTQAVSGDESEFARMMFDLQKIRNTL